MVRRRFDEDADTRPVHLYVLKDPRDGATRYVGVTRTSLASRVQGHLRDAKQQTKGAGYRKVNWIRSLLAVDVRPLIELVETVPAAEWREAERALIARLLDEGCRLVNGDAGGGGQDPAAFFGSTGQRRAAAVQAARLLPDGTKREWYSPEGKAAIAAANRARGQSPETRAKIAAAHRGVPLSDETRAKLSAIGRGRKQSPEHVAKRIAATTAKRRRPRPTCLDCGATCKSLGAKRCRPCACLNNLPGKVSVDG